MTLSLAVTTGSAQGVGPEIVRQAVQIIKPNVSVTVFGTVPKPDKLPSNIVWICFEDKNGQTASVRALLAACDAISEGNHYALVTGPVHKSEFETYAPIGTKTKDTSCLWGHTEILGDRFACQTTMAFLSNQFRVALMTQHVPLRDVSNRLTKTVLIQKIGTFCDFLRRWCAKNTVTIGVCGLNPHAQADSFSESEEAKLIDPALAILRQRGDRIDGPVSADTAFFQYQRNHWDGMISMYHDQALPVLKTHGIWQTVNVTLGLPFVRTSVDHGVGQTLKPDRANGTNMVRAIEWAVLLEQYVFMNRT